MKSNGIKGSLRTNFGKMNYTYEKYVFKKFCNILENIEFFSITEGQEKTIKQKILQNFIKETNKISDLYDFVELQKKDLMDQNHDAKCREKCGKVVAQYEIILGNIFEREEMFNRIEKYKQEIYESNNYFFVITCLEQNDETKKAIANCFSQVKLIHAKIITFNNRKQVEEKIVVLFYRMKDVIFTYGLSEKWKKCIADKYGITAQMIDTTEQYQDLFAYNSDVFIINPESTNTEVLNTIRDYFSEVDEEELPDLYFTKEIEIEISNARCWNEN